MQLDIGEAKLSRRGTRTIDRLSEWLTVSISRRAE